MVGGAIAGGYILLDLVSERAGNMVSIVVTVFVQYVFLENVLIGRLEPGVKSEGRRYGALFGSSFLSTLGILVASLFLIVPGIYFAGRWSLTSAFVVAERTSSTAALTASWEATRSSAMAVFVAQLVFVLGAIALVGGATGLAILLQPIGTWVEVVLLNAAVAAFSVGGWILAAAIFRLARVDQAALSNVFE